MHLCSLVHGCIFYAETTHIRICLAFWLFVDKKYHRRFCYIHFWYQSLLELEAMNMIKFMKQICLWHQTDDILNCAVLLDFPFNDCVYMRMGFIEAGRGSVGKQTFMAEGLYFKINLLLAAFLDYGWHIHLLVQSNTCVIVKSISSSLLSCASFIGLTLRATIRQPNEAPANCIHHLADTEARATIEENKSMQFIYKTHFKTAEVDPKSCTN